MKLCEQADCCNCDFMGSWHHCHGGKKCKNNMNQKQMASLGGKARALKLSKTRRLEISRLANEAKKLKSPHPETNKGGN